MSGKDCMIPEVWFTNVSEQVNKYNDEIAIPNQLPIEEATCYATGFVTSNYVENLLEFNEPKIIEIFLLQLKQVIIY